MSRNDNDTLTPLVKARAIAHITELAKISASPFTGWDPRYREVYAEVLAAPTARMVRAIMADEFEYGVAPHLCVWC